MFFWWVWILKDFIVVILKCLLISFTDGSSDSGVEEDKSTRQVNTFFLFHITGIFILNRYLVYFQFPPALRYKTCLSSLRVEGILTTFDLQGQGTLKINCHVWAYDRIVPDLYQLPWLGHWWLFAFILIKLNYF